jgi:alpha-2-macroglobulin
LMYRLLRGAGGYEKQMEKIRNYFLEKRKDGQWRNTYESALVLETILPDLLKEGSAATLPELSINGAATVSSFPYIAEINPLEKLVIKKTGSLPVYFTAYQQYWNAVPEKVSSDFSVNSSFEKNGQKINSMKAGQPVVLKVDVLVKADADYVMIEIPVPAGCSYGEKNQQYLNNEVHREYFKNKVSLFCSSLRKGVYTFTVSLVPRYTGSYRLNPAKAEMMYFPVFYGRESMKTVKIE